MQSTLFENSTIKQQSPNLEIKVTEDKIIQPLTQVLEIVTSKPEIQKSQNIAIANSISKSLDELFPEQQYEEKNIQKAKQILGPLANEFTHEQLKDTVNEVQYLTESWLDEFEREIFGGLTLKELLHEKGGI